MSSSHRDQDLHTSQLNVEDLENTVNTITQTLLSSNIEYLENRALLECKICFASFSWRNDYNRHMKEHKNGKDISACKICDKTFYLKSSYLRHMKNHEESKQYVELKRRSYCTSLEEIENRENEALEEIINRENVTLGKIINEENEMLEKIKNRKDHVEEIINNWENEALEKLRNREKEALEEINNEVNKSQLAFIEEKATIHILFSCKMCGKIFTAKETLKMHSKMYHEMKTKKKETRIRV